MKLTLHLVASGCISLVLPVSQAAAGNKVSQLAPGVHFMEVQTQPEFLGSNSAWIIFEDHVLVIDAGFPLSARAVVAEIKKTTDKPIRYVFDTHYHGDHSFGNGVYVELGATGVAQSLCIRDQRVKGIVGFAQQQESKNDLTKRQVAGARFKDATIAFDDKLVFDDGNQRVELLHFGHAHTPGDAVAYLPKHKILFTGDACVNGSFNYMGDGDVVHWIRVLQSLKQLEVTKIGPGHGPIAGKDLLDKQQRYFVELRRQIGAGIAASKSLAEIRDALDMPFYEEWTGVNVKKNIDNIGHVYNELLGVIPAHFLTRDIGLREGPTPTKADAGWTAPRKVLVPNLSASRLASLRAVAPGVDLVVCRNAQEAAGHASDADAVIGMASAEIVKAGEKLRWIQAASAGVETMLTIPGLVESRITLTNAQRVFAPEIADHVMAMLLSFTRGLRGSIPHQVAHKTWGLGDGNDQSRLLELNGKSMLVVGLGGIGTEVARRAHAFGMQVHAIDAKDIERPSFVFRLAKPGELLSMASQADVVVNCAPLTRETNGLFGEKFFAVMRKTAYFISVGRGESTDHDALYEALHASRIAGAGLDVTDPEPLSPNHRLYGLTNVIVTPHVGSRSDHREDRLFALYRENLRRFAAGERLLGVVDKRKGF